MNSNKKSHLLELLPDGSLYDFVPDLIAVTLEYGEFKIAQKDEVIAQEGDEIENLIIPIDENIKLYSDRDDEFVDIGFLQRKRSLALKELLFEENYPYSAKCENTTRYILVPKSQFLSNLKKHPLVENYLKLIVQSSGLRSFKTFLNSRGLHKKQIIQVFEHINLYDYELQEGEVISNNTNKLYFIKSGELEANFLSQESKFRKLKLHEGTFFGGESLLPPHVLSYEIKVKKNTTYHYANINDIKEVLADYDFLDMLYAEPWVTKRAKTKRIKPWSGILSELIGEPITTEELKDIASIINKTNFEIATSDKHSYFLNLKNYCELNKISINEAALESKFSKKDSIDIYDIAKNMQEYNVLVDYALLPKKNILKLTRPFLIETNNRMHLFIKYNKSDKTIFLLDAAVGIVKVAVKELEDNSFNCLFIESEKSLTKPSNLGYVIGILSKRKSLIVATFVFMFLGFSLSLLPPYLMQEILDEALLLKDVITVKSLSYMLLFVMFAIFVVEFFLQLVFRNVSAQYDRDLSRVFYKSTFSKPFSFFRKINTGEILSRFYELDYIRDVISMESLIAITDLMKVLAYGLILFAYDSSLALIPLALLLVSTFILGLFLKRLRFFNQEDFRLLSERNSILNEILASIRSIRVSKSAKKLKDKWEDSLVNYLKLKRNKQNENALFNWFLSFSSSTVRILILYVAVSVVFEGKMTLGAVLAVTIYVNRMLEPLFGLTQFGIKLQRNFLSINKVGEIIEDHFKPQENTHNHYANIQGKINLERVYFKYDSKSNWILEDVNLNIYQGQRLAIVGPSGSGKTTLAKVIAGHIEPSSGRIFYDDYDGALLTKSCVHENIHLIGQDTNIFAGDAHSNICLQDIEYNEDNYLKAIQETGAQEIIDLMDSYKGDPTKLKTESLSLGQRQKVSITRALYQRPQVLIMDEMTSGLDSFSERKIMSSIKSELKEKTQIHISYKSKIVEDVDLIIVMDKGKVIAQGSHTDLIKNNKVYSQLFL